MARVSRKGRTAGAEVLQTCPERVYRAAVYVRLSVINSDLERNRDSIEMQRYMLEKYVRDQADMCLAGVFCDNGETGTDFGRDGFERMMDGVRNRTIDCIVVKDLSRFGRNYVETGYYLEKIFPVLGVRFVSVNDRYDSLAGEKGNGLEISLKNLINDLYAKDISQKIHSSFATMREKGEYVGGPVPYGYQRAPEDKHRLVVDPQTAPVVRDIYLWRLEGVGTAQIARRLNEMGAVSPPMKQYLNGYRKQKPEGVKALWRGDHVRFIATHPVYAGHTAQGKTSKRLYDGQPTERVPRAEWVVVKNTHEGIVSQEVFDRVQELIKKRHDECCAMRGKYDTTENILKGLLVCADCGTKMVRHKSVSPAGVPRYVFNCRVYEQNLNRVGADQCGISHSGRKSVGEPELKESIISALRVQVELAGKLEKCLARLQVQPEFQRKRKELADRAAFLRQRIKRNTALKGSLFEALCEHTLTEVEYRSMKTGYEREAQDLKEELATLEGEERRMDVSLSPQNEWLSALRKYGDGDGFLSREAALELIQCIRVSGYNEIEIVWNFRDEFAMLSAEIQGVAE